MKRYVTGCQHYQDNDIINFCKRPYRSTDEMNIDQIKKHNAIVGIEDEVINTGDYVKHSAKAGGLLTAKDFDDQLNGKQIHIVGNHDRGNRNSLKTRTEEIILGYKNLKVQFLHDPNFARIDYKLIIHSHVHLMWRVKELRYLNHKSLLYNAGVDVNNFAPVNIEDILQIYYEWDSIKKDYDKTKSFLNKYNKGTKSEQRSY